MREPTFPTQQAEPISGPTQAITPVPDGYSPEGVAEAVIDPIIKYLIEQLIPGGWDVLVHILYYATVDPRTTMQKSLFHATGEANNEAIVLISAVEALAKTPNSPFRSPDAYSRRLVALETLKVIRRTFHRTFTEVRISLGTRSIYVPSLLVSLWDLHETYKDEKVKQLARKMAKRVKTGEFLSYAASTCVCVEPELAPVLHVLDSLLQARGITEEASTLASACGIIAKLLLPDKYGRVGNTMGEFHALLSKEPRSSGSKKGELATPPGELQDGAPPIREGTGAGSSLQKGELVTTESPECTAGKGKSRRYRVKKGEFYTLFATNSPEFGQFGRVHEEMGDSVLLVSLSDHYSSSNITNKGTESLNDGNTSGVAKQGEIVPSEYKFLPYRRAYNDTRPIEEIRSDARMYADLFDGVGNYQWIAKLITCIQQHPGHIRHLAVVDTLYHTAFPDDWRKKPRRPGGWFCKAAERFDAPGAEIPREVQLWAETGLAYNEIEEALQQGRRTPMETLLPMMSGGKDDQETTDTNGGERGNEGVQEANASTVTTEQDGRHPTRLCTSLRTRMNRSQAEGLSSRIEREGVSLGGIRAEVMRGEQGSSVVKTTWFDNATELFVNEGEWERHVEKVRLCFAVTQ